MTSPLGRKSNIVRINATDFLDELTSNLFCTSCGCSSKGHTSRSSGIAGGSTIYDCGNCGKSCRKKPGARSIWFRRKKDDKKKVRDPFEGGSL